MSRGRQAKVENKNTFLTQNPGAVEHDVQVSVEKNGIFELVASDGENPLPLDNGIIGASNKVSYLVGAWNPDGEFYAQDYAHYGGEDALISLSKDGIGVLGEDESEGSNPPRESRALDDDEVFGFRLDNELEHIGQNNIQWGWEEDDYGLSGVNIEFEVLNNKGGTVSLVMFENDQIQSNTVPNGTPFPGIIKEIEIEAGSKGQMEDIGFYLPEGERYDGFEIFVDGNVQIGMVGVDYSVDGMPHGHSM